MAKSDRKTKAELQNELSNTHDIPEEPEKGPVTPLKELENAKVKITELEKQEKELLTLRKDLENLKTKITELEKQEKKLVTLRKELEKAKAKIAELEKQEKELLTLRKDLENAKAKITELEKQEKKLVTLRKELEKAKAKITELEKQEKELLTLRKDLENAKAKITELKKQEKKLVTLHNDLENKNKSLIEQIADLQKTEETIPVYSGSSKSSFRIDIYPHEGHYQGKVVHLLTKEKKAFSGLNHKAIADFVNEHLPQSEESFVAPEPVASVPTKSPVETPNQASKTASIRKFTLVQKGKVQKEKSIPHNQVFQVVLIVDPLKSIFEENLPCPYKISVYAKRMGGGPRKTLGQTRGQITSAGEFTATVHCAPLPLGIYRFVAFGTYNIKKDQQESIGQFHESSMFNVT